MRCKTHPRELTVEDMTKRVLAGMKTRVYKTEKGSSIHHSHAAHSPARSASVLSGLGSTDSGAENCAICLSGYKTGDVSIKRKRGNFTNRFKSVLGLKSNTK